jgi:hypothetical protein
VGPIVALGHWLPVISELEVAAPEIGIIAVVDGLVDRARWPTAMIALLELRSLVGRYDSQQSLPMPRRKKPSGSPQLSDHELVSSSVFLKVSNCTKIFTSNTYLWREVLPIGWSLNRPCDCPARTGLKEINFSRFRHIRMREQLSDILLVLGIPSRKVYSATKIFPSWFVDFQRINDQTSDGAGEFDASKTTFGAVWHYRLAGGAYNVDVVDDHIRVTFTDEVIVVDGGAGMLEVGEANVSLAFKVIAKTNLATEIAIFFVGLKL